MSMILKIALLMCSMRLELTGVCIGYVLKYTVIGFHKRTTLEMSAHFFKFALDVCVLTSRAKVCFNPL